MTEEVLTATKNPRAFLRLTLVLLGIAAVVTVALAVFVG